MSIKNIYNNLGHSDKVKDLIINKILDLKPINTPINYDKNDFNQWLVGFTDGEGSFKASFRSNEKTDIINRMTFEYCIQLHREDKKVLEFIKNNLNIKNEIYDELNNLKEKSSIRIGNYEELSNIIIPLFNINNLNTKKYHDFNIWLKIFNLYKNDDLSFDNKYEELNLLKSSLNNYDHIHDNNNLNVKLNLPWYIGFMEGEGSYSVKYDINHKYKLISEVSQREESYKLFKELQSYLFNLECDLNCSNNIKEFLKKIKINIKEYKREKKIKLTLSSIDYFYWVYFPNILNTNWNSRKSIDMTLFMIANIILKHGLHYTEEGHNLFIKIRKTNNSNRYYNNDIIPSIEEIIKVLSIKPLYDIYNTQDYNGRSIGRKLIPIHKR